jgi:hypothetical protein
MSAETVMHDFDHGGSFTYRMAEPAFGLPQAWRVEVRRIPFALRIKGKGERSQYSEWDARCSRNRDPRTRA